MADDSDDLRRKAEWHRARHGKLKNASLARLGQHTYNAELMERGVKPQPKAESKPRSIRMANMADFDKFAFR